jgi:hypothetical protein
LVQGGMAFPGKCFVQADGLLLRRSGGDEGARGTRSHLIGDLPVGFHLLCYLPFSSFK